MWKSKVMHEQSFPNVINNATYISVSRSNQQLTIITVHFELICMIPWCSTWRNVFWLVIQSRFQPRNSLLWFYQCSAEVDEVNLTRWTFRWFFRRENSRFRLDKGGLTNILTAKRYSIMSYWCLIPYDNKYNSSVKRWFW